MVKHLSSLADLLLMPEGGRTIGSACGKLVDLTEATSKVADVTCGPCRATL